MKKSKKCLCTFCKKSFLRTEIGRHAAECPKRAIKVLSPSQQVDKSKRKNRRKRNSTWPPTQPTSYWLSKERKVSSQEARERLRAIKEFEKNHDVAINVYLIEHPEPELNPQGLPADKFKISWKLKRRRR